jgi:uncharacterized Zn finger protein (UPF0148 family)
MNIKHDHKPVKHEIMVTCPICAHTSTLVVSDEQYRELLTPVRERRYIQEILHDKPAKERELLLSGLCFACQDELFGKDDI